MRALGLRLLVTFVLLFAIALLFAVSMAGAADTRPAAPSSTASVASRSASPAEPPLTGAPDSTSVLGAGAKLLVASLALAGLLYLAMRAARRLPISRFLPSTEGPIRLVARTHLGSRESLCLLEVGSTRLLVGISAQGMETLHVWPEGVTGTAVSATAPTAVRSFETPGQLRALQARLPGAGR